MVPGQLGGMVVVTLVPRRHAGRAAWWSSAPGSCSACAKKSCHVQRHMAALRSAHMGSATQIHSSGTETKLVGHMARYGKLVIKFGPLTGRATAIDGLPVRVELLYSVVLPHSSPSLEICLTRRPSTFLLSFVIIINCSRRSGSGVAHSTPLSKSAPSHCEPAQDPNSRVIVAPGDMCCDVP